MLSVRALLDGLQSPTLIVAAPDDRLDTVIRAHVARIVAAEHDDYARAAKRLGIWEWQLCRMLKVATPMKRGRRMLRTWEAVEVA